MVVTVPEAPQHEVDQQMIDPGYSRTFKARAAVSGAVRGLKESYLGTAYGIAEKIYGKDGSRTRRLLGGAALLTMTTPVAYGLVRGINMLDHMGADAMQVPSQPPTVHLDDDSAVLTAAHSPAHAPTDASVTNHSVKNGEGIYDLLDRDGVKDDKEKHELIWGDSKGAKEFRTALYENDDAEKITSNGHDVPSMNHGKLSDEAFGKLQAFDAQWDTDHPADVDPTNTLDGGRTIQFSERGNTVDINLPKGYEHELTQTHDGFKLTINPDGKDKTFTVDIPEKYFDKHGITAEGKQYLAEQLKAHNLQVGEADVQPNAAVTPAGKLDIKDVIWHGGKNDQSLSYEKGHIHVDLNPKGSHQSHGYPKWDQPFKVAITDKNGAVYLIDLDEKGNAKVDPHSVLGKVLENGTYRNVTPGQFSDGKFHGIASMMGNGRADFKDYGNDGAKLVGTHAEVNVTEQSGTPAPVDPTKGRDGGNTPQETTSPSPSATPSSSDTPSNSQNPNPDKTLNGSPPPPGSPAGPEGEKQNDASDGGFPWAGLGKAAGVVAAVGALGTVVYRGGKGISQERYHQAEMARQDEERRQEELMERYNADPNAFAQEVGVSAIDTFHTRLQALGADDQTFESIWAEIDRLQRNTLKALPKAMPQGQKEAVERLIFNNIYRLADIQIGYYTEEGENGKRVFRGERAKDDFARKLLDWARPAPGSVPR